VGEVGGAAGLGGQQVVTQESSSESTIGMISFISFWSPRPSVWSNYQRHPPGIWRRRRGRAAGRTNTLQRHAVFGYI